MLRGLVCQGLLAWLALLGLSQASRGEDAAARGSIEFNRDVRPILAENCFRCHGPDSASRKADLRLDRREVAVESAAIVPGKPDESGLVERIFSTDPDKVMPPPAIHKELKPAEKELLKQWVAAGAEYQAHWSLIAPVRPALPAVKNEAWIRTPIDRFILARLEQHGLAPAPPADRYTLARRLSLDLIGLPPEPAEVERFVNDPSADAYEQYVDRLLAMPEWGEHRGRYWLDAARYGDSHGIHVDNFREIWSYRNWVIRALNDNMPFDRFTIEQLAGDLLPNRTLEQQIASGFNRCNITTSEGGAIDEEYRVLYDRDRTETTSQVWLGLTTGCAVCHDHKFDPISQREFYELAAFFNNTTQAAMDGNIKDTPPIQFVPKPEERARYDQLAAELPAVRGQIETRKQTARADFDPWLAAGPADEIARLIPSDGLRLQSSLSEGSGDTVNMTFDGQTRSLTAAGVAWDAGHVAAQSFKSQPGTALEIAEAGDFEKDQPFTAAVWVKLSQEGMSGAIIARMNDQVDHRGWDLGVEGGRVNVHLINNWDTDALKIVTNSAVKVGEWNHLLMTYDGSGKAAGVKIYFNGALQPSSVAVDRLQSTIRTEVPLKIAQRHNASRLNGAAIQDLRIYGRGLADAEVAQLAKATRIGYLVAKPAAERSEPETAEVFAWWLGTLDKPTQELNGKLANLDREEKEIKSRGTIAHVMQERTEPAMAFILFRGDYDKRRDQVAPGTPAALPPMPADLPRNRLGLAQWLLRPEHPLTARVTVNRYWQELFGTGLVRTTGDFGVSGETPSHPELLDWMAVEFRESGWDMKKFYRLLVTSAAYRQAATLTPEKLEKDGQNRLVSRGPRFRMDAEVVRDYALASSGLLVHTIGGPSVRPYQPPGVWEAVAMPGSNTRDYVQDHGENLYRRSMYTFWKRSAPPASMEILNAPSREFCTVRRERTNTPMQALVVLNDPQFIEASRYLAQRTLTVAGDAVENRLDFLGRRLLARPWRMEELAVLEKSVASLVGYYQGHPDEAKQLIAVGEIPADPSLDVATLAGWTMLANEVMNLDEVVCK